MITASFRIDHPLVKYFVVLVTLLQVPLESIAQKKPADARAGWKVKFEGSESIPVISEHVLYVGSLDGKLYTFNAASGQELWTISTGEGLTSGPEIVSVPHGTDLATQMNMIANRPLRGRKKEIRGTPLINDHMVWVGSEDFLIYAIDATKGEVKWTFETGGRINTTPIVDDASVFFVSEDGLLYALDKFSGQIKWEAKTYPGAPSFNSQPGPTPNPPNQPVLGDGAIYLSNWVPGKVKKVFITAVSVKTGDIIWSSELEGWDVDVPIVIEDQLIVLYETNGSATEPSALRTMVMEASSGNTLWTFDQKMDYGFDFIAADVNAVYVESPLAFIVLDRQSGERRWQYIFDEKRNNLSDKGFYIDQMIYLVDHGQLLVIDPVAYSIKNTLKVDRFFRVHHVEGPIVYGSSLKQVIALDIATGDTLWSRSTGTALSSYPVYYEGMIYFTTNSVGYVGMSKKDQGHLFAVNAVTGK